MKRKVLAVLALITIVFLTGCSAISSGYITDKIYTAPYTSGHFQCFAYNKDGACTTNIWVTDYYPATYRFDLQYNEETGWVRVSEHTYNQYEIGDFYGKADSN